MSSIRHETTRTSETVFFPISSYDTLVSEHSYWAKDVIFLISEHEQLGAKAWLEAYHGVGSFDGVLDTGVLASRSGAIQAAINLEFHSMAISSIDVKIEGLTGQLPNLDLFNLVVRLCGRDGVPVTHIRLMAGYTSLVH